MITENTQKFLDNLVKKLSYRDYLTANPKRKIDKKTGCPIHNPYRLSDDTLEALRLYKLSIKNNITLDEEEEIKAYVLKRKLIY